MTELLLTNKVLILRIAFLYFFARELYLTKFKRQYDKYIWFCIVLVFGFVGYPIYLASRRRLIMKRKFNPSFNKHNSLI